MREPIKVNLKIITGRINEVEKEYNKFKEDKVIHFQESQSTPVISSEDVITWTYHIFVYYNPKP